MVRAAGGAAVADRHPPTLRRRALAGEPHLLDEGLGDLGPPPVRELWLLRMQRQRAVPRVRVARAGRGARSCRARRSSPGCRTPPAARRGTAPARRRRSARAASSPPSGRPREGRRPGAGSRAPRACPCRPGRAARRASCHPRVTFGITAGTPVSFRSSATSSSTSASVCSEPSARADLPGDVRRVGELVDVVRDRRQQPASLEQLGHHPPAVGSASPLRRALTRPVSRGTDIPSSAGPGPELPQRSSWVGLTFSIASRATGSRRAWSRPSAVAGSSLMAPSLRQRSDPPPGGTTAAHTADGGCDYGAPKVPLSRIACSIGPGN